MVVVVLLGNDGAFVCMQERDGEQHECFVRGMRHARGGGRVEPSPLVGGFPRPFRIGQAGATSSAPIHGPMCTVSLRSPPPPTALPRAMHTTSIRVWTSPSLSTDDALPWCCCNPSPSRPIQRSATLYPPGWILPRDAYDVPQDSCCERTILEESLDNPPQSLHKVA